jgi:hypothetical protein
MRIFSSTVTGVANTPSAALDYYINPFNVSLSALVTGTVTYTVYYTFDDISVPGWTVATGNWTAHPTLTAQVATKDANIAYPVTAVYLAITAGTGSVRLNVIQAG